MSSSKPLNPLFPQTGRFFSHSPLIAIGARAMSDAPAKIGSEATEAMEPTAATTPAPAPMSASESVPAPDGVEDIEMAGSTPAAATAQDQPSAPVASVSEMPVQPAQQQQQQQQQQTTQMASAPLSAPSPVPASTSAPSARNSPHPSGPAQVPVHAMLHGSPTRQYLNSHVTPHLLEAMKHLVTLEPEKPLEFMSKYLAQKSLELEN